MRSLLLGLKRSNPNNKTLVAGFVSSLLRLLPPLHSPMSTQSFQLRLDPLTGDSEWVVIHEADKDQETQRDALSQSLLARTSYLDMLNNSCRNRAYRRAIEAAVTRPCHVIDIGCILGFGFFLCLCWCCCGPDCRVWSVLVRRAGTGLLSMMAAHAMARVGGGKEGRVTACESYLPTVKQMRRVLRANCMEGKVRLFPRRSDELRVGRELDSRADLMASEILDSELLGEGLVPTLQHEHDELLVPNPQMIPYGATVYGQLVESTFLGKLCDLHNQEISASDRIRLSLTANRNLIPIKPKQYAMHCDALSSEIKLKDREQCRKGANNTGN